MPLDGHQELVGRHLNDRYRMDAILGQGGMGAVYRGRDTLLERTVAVKVLTAASLTIQGRQRLLREARAVARLSHPNIIRVFDAGETQVPGYEAPLPYIVMEFVEGASLHDHPPANLAETIDIILQVCAALDHAHRQGVIHRDLKPENILVTPDGTALLMDFGLARTGASRLTGEGATLGTVFYLAPEIALGEAFDARADLYSLGVLLYELTTGQLPFSADDPVAVIGQHLHQAVTPPQSLNPKLPESLNDLIVQLLSKDPLDRPVSAASVAEKLRELAGAKVSPAPPALDGSPELPGFLMEIEGEGLEGPTFVARDRELAQLTKFFHKIQTGQGSVAFVVGGPGRGKSALMEAFARSAQREHPDLIVAQGACNALTGVGDPYAPFRQVLAALCGDVETKWASGAITRDHARRLWKLLPDTVQALVDVGPDLVDVFIPGGSLLTRLKAAAPDQHSLRQSLQELINKERAVPGEMEQKALFEQYLNVLCKLASRQPLLILLDDLQWADSASYNLLFHLGRGVSAGRILLLGAYRPEEVALGRAGERHPLEEILAELKRLYGDVWIDLSHTPQQDGQRFVGELINSEPNRLGGSFRKALFNHTEGHPLFTIELLREMQARGDLVRDERGDWIEGEALNWNLLPARVDGVIAARIGRLQDELRQTLTIASVEGEDFTAQVVARVKEVDARGLVRQLSGELDKVHRLVGERGVIQIAGQRLYRYGFQHHLFQKFLYNGLGENERELLHAEVGHVLEELYGEQSDEVAAQLASHFSAAGEVDKAIHYALLAGDQARGIYAYQEAITYYQQAVEYLKKQGDVERAARTLMKLGLTYHTIFKFRRSREAFEEAFALRQQAGTTPPADLESAPHPYRIRFSDPPTLDPTKAGDQASILYLDNIFSKLVDLGVENEIVPDVAHRWEISEDGRQYLFYLRDDAFWSDGTQVTAADFEYALKRTLDPNIKFPNSIAIYYYDVKGAQAYHVGEISDPDQVGVRALDAFTLELELEQPASYFLHLLTTLSPVPRHVVERYWETWAEPDKLVSNGPFLLDSYLPGESITLSRNPAYHGRFPGNLEVVEVNLNLTHPAALARYEADGADILGLDTETYHARHRHIEEYESIFDFGTNYVSFDSSRPPFDELSVRQAFVLAVDLDRLAGEVLGGYHHPATGGFVPPGIPGHLPGIALPFDPDQAHQLLSQTGYPDGRDFPALQFDVPLGMGVNIAEYLVAQWRHNLNVEVAVEVTVWKEFLEKKHSSNLVLFGWNADYPDPDNFLRVCLSRNVPVWQSESYERLLDRARRTTNQGERIRLFQAADKILIEEVAIMPLTYLRWHGLVKPWVKFPKGSLRYWKNVIIEPH